MTKVGINHYIYRKRYVHKVDGGHMSYVVLQRELKRSICFFFNCMCDSYVLRSTCINIYFVEIHMYSTR